MFGVLPRDRANITGLTEPVMRADAKARGYYSIARLRSRLRSQEASDAFLGMPLCVFALIATVEFPLYAPRSLSCCLDSHAPQAAE